MPAKPKGYCNRNGTGWLHGALKGEAILALIRQSPLSGNWFFGMEMPEGYVAVSYSATTAFVTHPPFCRNWNSNLTFFAVEVGGGVTCTGTLLWYDVPDTGDTILGVSCTMAACCGRCVSTL